MRDFNEKAIYHRQVQRILEKMMSEFPGVPWRR
jgi:hypothetical protein